MKRCSLPLFIIIECFRARLVTAVACHAGMELFPNFVEEIEPRRFGDSNVEEAGSRVDGALSGLAIF